MTAPSLSAIGSVAYKEFLHIYRDRRVLLLLLILPPLFTLLFGQAFETSEIKDVPGLLINRDNTAQTQRFVDIILKNKTFRWRQASPDVTNESDLLGNRVEAEVGVAFFVASYSALKKTPVSPALLVLGDMSVQGNIKPLRSLTEPLQVAKDNGAKRALIPIENKRNFLDVSADIVEHVDPVFYGDPKTAAMKVLGNL